MNNDEEDWLPRWDDMFRLGAIRSLSIPEFEWSASDYHAARRALNFPGVVNMILFLDSSPVDAYTYDKAHFH